jgi:hypothetical protein
VCDRECIGCTSQWLHFSSHKQIYKGIFLSSSPWQPGGIPGRDVHQRPPLRL